LKRKVHESRFALLLSNESICASKAHPIVVVAPMTHDVSIRLETDVLVTRHRENGLLSDSLVQLHLIQPLLKTDVVSREGTLSAADWDLVLETLVWMTDRA
jgi:mRNA-degrading endonuclease toxin of MazEF toxin-antitoxin module